MQESDPKHWLNQLEVTGPIKGIMDFVDELARNYDKRVAALHLDFQKDVEEMLACYKQEKQEFSTQLTEQTKLITNLQRELNALQQSYHTQNVEYRLTKECLATARSEIATLTAALNSEEELMAITTQRINIANAQLCAELQARGTEPTPVPMFDDLDAEIEVPNKGKRFKRSRYFFKQIISDRLTRPIVIRPQKQEPIINLDDIPDNEEYSF